MDEAIEIVITSYAKDLCKGVWLGTTRGVAYLLIGNKEYPLIEGTVPPFIHLYLRDGHLAIYSFWRTNGKEHEAFIKAALTKLHLIPEGILVEPHGSLEKFEAFVIIKLIGSDKILEMLKRLFFGWYFA
ncbi:hypothetical protein [Pyrococcus sp. NA2]|uniref:hypothetical protein n=1 Tax=Pyrococcus sp. (strain NA2) TaxID=342949 RepID=UPI000A5D4988|nr:hypothetical protein [Pyrococcus sp. NA2]